MIHGKIPMKRRKRTQADKERDDAAAERRLLAKFRKHGAVVIDRSRLFSRSVCGYFRVPTLGLFYKDYEFVCRDCGVQQTWTAGQQKWWYEDAGGEMEAVAIRCRACRIKERERKDEARRVHLEGLARKAVER